MIVDGEKAIVQAISDAFTYFRANLSTLVPQIFPNESSTNQTAIESWWGNASNQVFVQVGYLLQPVSAPQVAVTIESEREGEQFAGSERAGLVISIGSDVSDVDAIYMETMYACHCVGINQDFVLWLQMLTKWALLLKRKSLMQQVQADGQITGVFQRQRIAAAPFRPVPDGVFHEGIFPFERVVTLSATHLDTWASEDVAPSMSSSSSVIVTDG